MRNRFLFLGIASTLIMGLLLGCGGKEIQREDLLEQLRTRVDLLWQASVDKDISALYQFHTPEFREKISPIEYNAAFANAFRTVRYSIDRIELDEAGTSAKVMVSNTFLAPYMPHARTVPGQETLWVLVDGIWYVDAPTEAPQNLSGGRRK